MAVDVGQKTRLERYAELAVRVGANVEEGQLVIVAGLVEHGELIRAVTRAAYEAGARYVDAVYRDQHVRKAMIELGPTRRCAGRRPGCSRKSATWRRSTPRSSRSPAIRSPI